MRNSGPYHQTIAKLGQEAFSTVKSRENASMGAMYPKHFRGVAFILWAMACNCVSVAVARLGSRKKNCCIRLLEFSLVPFCQGAWGLQK
jgi:hypothetical protein